MNIGLSSYIKPKPFKYTMFQKGIRVVQKRNVCVGVVDLDFQDPFEQNMYMTNRIINETILLQYKKQLENFLDTVQNKEFPNELVRQRHIVQEMATLQKMSKINVEIEIERLYQMENEYDDDENYQGEGGNVVRHGVFTSQ